MVGEEGCFWVPGWSASAESWGGGGGGGWGVCVCVDYIWPGFEISTERQLHVNCDGLRGKGVLPVGGRPSCMQEGGTGRPTRLPVLGRVWAFMLLNVHGGEMAY